MGLARRLALAAGLGAAGAALWWRKNPSACPYSQRFWVEAPHPFITRARLREVLSPSGGERILEVGPGTGYYSLPVAGWLGPDGRLDVLDIQQEMLDHTLRRAAEEGISNIAAERADAREMPYPDDTFDAAYLVTVLGEIPDQSAALRELRRVVKPDGRIVVGELFGDPHMVTFRALRERAEAAGLAVDHRLGGRLWHFTRLRPS
ncbi:MAG TPA: methyltransferase domain-containing protein [Thermoleophilaceae bacterium]|nr:methyltransferase domain-containing protein [Thermoleophilaceae bacterium]